jgi:hypothetical protein
LKQPIREAAASVTPDALGPVWHEMEYSIDVCRATNGAHVVVECKIDVLDMYLGCDKHELRSKYTLTSNLFEDCENRRIMLNWMFRKLPANWIEMARNHRHLWALVLWHLVFLSSLRTPADFSCP